MTAKRRTTCQHCKRPLDADRVGNNCLSCWLALPLRMDRPVFVKAHAGPETLHGKNR